MFKAAFHLLLVVLLAGCPVFRISAATTSVAGGKSAPSGCRPCCQASDERADQSVPEPTTPPDCPCQSKCGNCICSGAIVKVTDLASLLTAQPYAGQPEPAGVIASDSQPTVVDSIDRGSFLASDGRSLRARICSLLC